MLLQTSISHLKISLIFVIDLGLYVSLITLPGSGPYKIFHPVIYSKALQTLQIIKKIPALHGPTRRYLKFIYILCLSVRLFVSNKRQNG